MEGGIAPVNGGLSYYESLPPGYTFRPTDFELIHHFLRKRSLDPPLSFEEIHEINIYDYNPEHLTAIYHRVNGAKEWYFFSPWSRNYMEGNRPVCSAGDGYWKATAKDEKIYSYDGRKEGRKRTLVFYQGDPHHRNTSIKTNWIMQEYVLADSYLPRQNMHNNGDGIVLLNKYVLCMIYKKRGNKNSNPAPADADENNHGNNNNNISESLPSINNQNEELMPLDEQINGGDGQLVAMNNQFQELVLEPNGGAVLSSTTTN